VNTILDLLLIAVAVAVGYRFGQRQHNRFKRQEAWADGFETGAAAMAATTDPVVITAAHRDAQLRNAREGWQ
jgi:hypothetical protein